MKRNFLLLLVFLPVLALVQPYTVTQLSLEKGLSNNFVVSIAQDKEGFLWFATEEGLNKFDGSRFISYYKEEGSQRGITGNELNCLLDDPVDSILWIGTQRSGLNAYDYIHDSFRFYLHDPKDLQSLATNDITNIQPAADGNLWITTYWKGVDYFNKKKQHFIHYNQQTVAGLASNHIWSVADGGNGILYIGHVHEGFSILYVKERRAKNFRSNPLLMNSLPGNDVHCVYKDKTGNIWVGTDKGLALFDPVKENFISFAKNNGTLSNTVFDIRQFDDSKLWIATEFGGIAILDLSQRLFLLPQQVQFQYIKEGDDKYSLASSSVRCLYQDSYKNVWAGLWGGGVNFLSRGSSLFKTLGYSSLQSSSTSLNAKAAISACIDKSGKLWVGTDGGGINVFDKGKRIHIYRKESGDLSSNSIQAAYCDSRGNLWFGVFNGGAYHYDMRTGKFHQIFPTESKNADVRSFFEDKDQQIWISTSEGIYKANLVDQRITTHHDLTNNLVRSVLKDSQGRIWVGTFGGGIGVYNAGFKFIRMFNTDSCFPSNTINQVYEDSEKRVWVATGEGLVCFPSSKGWKYQLYGWNSGLNNVHTRAITEDKHGNIWISTNKGISCLMKGQELFSNYDHHDNVPMGSFASGCVTAQRDGTLYFGSNNGICYFNPEQVLTKRNAPPVIITGMKIFGSLNNSEASETEVTLTSEKKIKLNYTQNNFSITFNVQNYALTDQVEYAYMLEGLDDEWYTVNDNKIAFRNIPSGKYRLLIKARIRNQEWSKDIASRAIEITPPLWRTWWAEFFYILVAIGVLIAFLRAYRRKVNLEYLYASEKINHEHEQELNNERLRFFTNITHELRTPLTLILGPLEDMLRSNSLSTKDQHKISIIQQSALRLFNLINQILEFRKTETQNKKICVSRGNIVATVYEVGLKYKELNQKQAVNIQIDTEQENLSVYYDKEIVTIILDNLISNAIKYTEKGEILINIYQTQKDGINYVEMKISDTGYGISAEALPHIFDRYYQEQGEHQASGTGIGLALVKNLVTLHEGEIWAESTLNVGSSFYFRLLVDNSYPDKLHADSEEKEVVENEQSNDQQEGDIEPNENNNPILLVIEDNLDILNYIADAFKEQFDVRTAENGKQGLEQAFDCIPDIIVSDIMMPGMDGTVLCRKLKEDVRTSHIPIILLTAKDSLQDKEEGYQAGADSYLTKPFSASLLFSRIQNLLEQRKRLFEKSTTGSVPNFDDKRTIITDALNKLDQEFIEKIDRLIEERLSSDKIDISYLAEHLYMSNSTLYRKMKALTGLSTNEYIRKIKMKHAELLLLEGKYSISEIAFKIGMNSPGYFRQCFKEEFGMVPTDYLKKLTSE
jgi:signal transduction histidine kinase/ligand-binding sensor domain-containing protein/DNA-binding response OmpR family regulator